MRHSALGCGETPGGGEDNSLKKSMSGCIWRFSLGEHQDLFPIGQKNLSASWTIARRALS